MSNRITVADLAAVVTKLAEGQAQIQAQLNTLAEERAAPSAKPKGRSKGKAKGLVRGKSKLNDEQFAAAFERKLAQTVAYATEKGAEMAVWYVAGDKRDYILPRRKATKVNGTLLCRVSPTGEVSERIKGL